MVRSTCTSSRVHSRGRADPLTIDSHPRAQLRSQGHQHSQGRSGRSLSAAIASCYVYNHPYYIQSLGDMEKEVALVLSPISLLGVDLTPPANAADQASLESLRWAQLWLRLLRCAKSTWKVVPRWRAV